MIQQLIPSRRRPSSARSARSANRAAPAESGYSVEVFPTALGWMALVQRGEVLCGLTFGHASARQAEAVLRELLGPVDMLGMSSGSELAEDLQRYAAGEEVGFGDVPIDVSHLTPFGRRVVEACRRIPRGHTRSYGELAAACGSPGAARAVGQVMAKNLYPLVVPCHRVLASGGSLGGYSAPSGLVMKRRLLRLEQSRV